MSSLKLLTEDAVLVCTHELGIISNAASQPLVTVHGRRLLVEADPERRGITGCPNVGVAIKPCTLTLAVAHGYSDLMRVQGRRICLANLSGLTDGTPPGTVKYKVRSPGQNFVSEA